MSTKNPTAWHTTPKDQGQIVTVAWTGAGSYGAIRRITDRADGSVAYALHQWSDTAGEGDFEPWSTCPIESGVVLADGASLDERSVRAMLAEIEGGAD